METRVVNNIPEWRYQAAVIARLHRMEDEGLPIACAGDMNRAKRNRRAQMEAKVTGITAGEPDIRVYMPFGLLLSIELKTPTGRRSKDQRERHARLAKLDFIVLTFSAETPEDLADLVEADIRSRLD